MDKKSVRKKLEALYNFQVGNVGRYYETFEVVPGVELEVDYTTSVAYGDYEFIVNSAKLNASEDHVRLFRALDMDVDDLTDSGFVENAMHEYLNIVVDECNSLFEDIDRGDRDELSDFIDIDELSSNFDSFEDAWDSIENDIQDESEFFTISNEYVAEFTKGKDGVVVGCQTIPIKKIRELVAAFDKFQKD